MPTVTLVLLGAILAGVAFLVFRSFVLAGRIRDLASVARWMLDRIPANSEARAPSRYVPGESPHDGGWHRRNQPAPDPEQWEAELQADPALAESNPVYRVDSEYAAAVERLLGNKQLTSAEVAEVADHLARTDDPDRAAIAEGE